MDNINIFASYCRRLTPTRVRYIFEKNNASLNKFNTTLLNNASFNLFLFNLNIYKHFFLHIDIIIKYCNNTYKKVSLIKSISNNDSNKYINVDLTNFIKSIDLDEFKIIFIDIYTKNILLHFSSRAILKSPYINLKFNTYENLHNSNNTNIPIYNKLPSEHYQPISNNKIDTNTINSAILKENNFSLPSPYKYITINKPFCKYTKKKFYYLIKKFLNKYVKVKVEFNGIKVLNGILDKVTSDTITLTDKYYKHVVCTDSISIISSDEHINTDDLICNTKYSDISVVLNYLKDKKINLNLNDKDLNLYTVTIINSCDSFLQVEDINTKKIYYLNLDYIKTIESIPIE